MPAVNKPLHQKGDYLVDYEEKVFEDVKAEPGEKALVTFHTVAFEGSIGFVNLLQATRLQRKGFETSVLLYGPGVTLGVQRGFPKLGDEAFPGHQNFNNQIDEVHGRRRQGLRLPLRAAGALWPRRAFADPRHPADQPARRARPRAAPSQGQRLHHRHLDAVSQSSQQGSTMTDNGSSAPPRCRSRPIFETPDGTLEQGLRGHRRGRGKGVQLIVFPETFVPYYPYFSFVQPPVAIGRGAHAALRASGRRAGPGRRRRWPQRARRTAWSSCSASTSATTARSTTRSSSSTPTASWCSSAARSRRRFMSA